MKVFVCSKNTIMRYKAKIKAINSEIEEELLIHIKGTTFTCFVEEFLYELKQGGTYPVELYGTVLDELEMEEQASAFIGIEQIEESFAYYVNGKFRLCEKCIDAGVKIQFEDAEDLTEYWHLENKFVWAKVDRLSIEFLPL